MMIRESLPKFLVSLFALGWSAQFALAQSATVTVNANQGPWQQSLNPSFNYGDGTNATPTVISAANGISFASGGTVTISYVSGQVNVYPEGGFPATDANGNSADPTNNTVIATYGSYPSFYVNANTYPVYASELVGTFANNGVIVGTPFAIGDGPKSFTIPSGANQLLLGVDDNDYNDNVGSWQIKVSSAAVVQGQSTTVTVNGDQGPWQQSLNPNFNYGFGDNQAPAIVNASSGIPFTTGGTLTVTYVSGQVNILPGNGFPYADANGDTADPTNNTIIPTYGDYPSYFMDHSSYPVYAGALAGTFANNGVIVGTPFPIGDGPATFVIPAGANELQLGVNDDYFVDNVGSWQISVSYAPLVVSSVVNGASFQPGIVPGSWATIQGANLSAVTDTWDNFIVNGKLPTTVDGVSVTIGGQAAYIYYVSPGQINFIVPEVPAGSQQVIVKDSAGTSSPSMVTVGTYGPAFFPWPNDQVVATRQDFSLAAKNGTFAGAATVPAKPGDTIILWGTGFGPTNPTPGQGEETPGNATYSTSTLPTVTIDNLSATVYGAALAPGFAGLYQVAIQVPASLGNGDWPIVASIGGVSSASGTVLTVQQ
jgi:uncharacterized protein (TIGR03437 family)